MPDRDKVIDYLQSEIYRAEQSVDDIWLECVEVKLLRDALALLKEQEIKTGHWIDTTNTIGFPRCECSECNSEAGAIWMKYCPNCGAKMKQEGR